MYRPARAWVFPSDERMVEAVEAGGGTITEPEDANVLIVNWHEDRNTELRRRLHPGVEWVQVGSAGVDGLFEEGLIDEDRFWTGAQGAFAQPIAEYVVGAVLALLREFPRLARMHHWTGESGRMLSDVTVGIVGGGGIGTHCTRFLSSLGARVIVVSRSPHPVEGAAWARSVDALPELLGESDVVVLAVPLTAETRGLIGSREFNSMRPGAFLINVARGQVVDTDGLVKMLRNGHIAGAVLDVVDPEPLPDGHALWDLENVLITPHTACSTEMSLDLMVDRVRTNVTRFRHGERLLGLIDPRKGY